MTCINLLVSIKNSCERKYWYIKKHLQIAPQHNKSTLTKSDEEMFHKVTSHRFVILTHTLMFRVRKKYKIQDLHRWKLIFTECGNIQLSNYYVTQNVSIQIVVNLILLDKQSILLPDIFFQTALSIIRWYILRSNKIEFSFQTVFNTIRKLI